MPNARSSRPPNLGWLRYLGWGLAAALLLTPLVAMRFAPGAGVNWTASDFVFAAVMFGTVGGLLELAVRASDDWSYRLGAALGLLTGLLLIWSDLAVGYIGDGGSAINTVFLAIPPLALVGAALVRFRANGMALVMLLAAVAHAIAGAIGYPADPVTGPITIVFTLLWLGSAALFRRAAG